MSQFTIEIRNAATGEAKNFHDKQGIADFLAGRADADQWEGFQNLGELPPPSEGAAPSKSQAKRLAAQKAPEPTSVPAPAKKSIRSRVTGAVKAVAKKVAAKTSGKSRSR